MPVYDYQCKSCDHEFSREQRITENPVKKCPECGGMKAKRLISQTAFLLKGTGWYNDLYSSSKPSKGEEGGKGDDKTEKKSEKTDKADSKADKKPKSSGKSSEKGGSKKSKSAA